MNNKANLLLSGVIALFIFVMGVLFLPFLTDMITSFRVSLQCSSSTLTFGTMLACLLSDVTTPYYIWGFISICGGMIIGSKF
jgi:hypothetical protein